MNKSGEEVHVRKHILMVDDDPESIQTLRILLNTYGYHVSCVCNTKDAFEEILSGSIDVVITDIAIPGGMSGVDIVKTCRKAHIPVLVCSGNSDSCAFADALQDAGYNWQNVLRKPVRFETLLNSIEMNLMMNDL